MTKSVAVFPLRATCEHATQFWSQGLSCSRLVDCMSAPDKESIPPSPGQWKKRSPEHAPNRETLGCNFSPQMCYSKKDFIYIFFVHFLKYSSILRNLVYIVIPPTTLILVGLSG